MTFCQFERSIFKLFTFYRSLLKIKFKFRTHWVTKGFFKKLQLLKSKYFLPLNSWIPKIDQYYAAEVVLDN